MNDWMEIVALAWCALLSHLCFWQVQLPGQLCSLAPHHILTPLELELQSVQLLGRKWSARPLGPVQVQAFGQDDLPDGAFGVYRKEKRNARCARIFALIFSRFLCTQRFCIHSVNGSVTRPIECQADVIFMSREVWLWLQAQNKQQNKNKKESSLAFFAPF